MTKKFKDFGNLGAEQREPISFQLYGEEFNCRPALQGKMLLDLIAKTSDTTDPAAGAKVIGDFFKGVLLEESFERFDRLINDPDKIIDIEGFGTIVAWLVEQYTERPTQRPEVSSSGQ
ncbi:tail assembly chaperone [Actinomycetia phage DSL-LC01]|nr:tail assembly chaperone [Actinomycetia phage DSL-LC01]